MSEASIHLLIEGWRGVNHSYALLAQHQAVAMSQIGGVALYHHDLPFAFPRWNAIANDSGLDARARSIVDGLRRPIPDRDRIDAVYRICSPFRARSGQGYDDRPTTTFMITESGLSALSFCDGDERSAFFTRDDNRIVTSSVWSRNRILDHGFPPDRVHVVPLGVDAGSFVPSWPDARQRARKILGFNDDETVFLNIGAPIWTKGTDLLLRAFAVLRHQGLPVRLLVKDQSDLYGVPLTQMIETVGSGWSTALRDSVLSAITAVSQNLSSAQLSALFGASDCYVSPYRAEGFNLPVLEAIACGVPTIVTRGGATDDFCDDDLSLRVEGQMRTQKQDDGAVTTFMEPDLDALVAAMGQVARGWRPDAASFWVAQRRVLDRFNWQQSARETIQLMLDRKTGGVAAS